MIRVSARNLSISYGTHALLDKVNFQINQGDKICLIGRNGAGKSTLLKIIAGHVQADSGELSISQQVSITELVQEVPQDTTGSIYDVVASGLGEAGSTAVALNAANERYAQSGSDKDLNEMQRLQEVLEDVGGWETLNSIDKTLSKLDLKGELSFSELSGGMKRKVLLARALVSEPSLLLLDEPTNHLDIEVIDWLENFLQNYRGTLLFISHDRAFMQKIANRILELDRGMVTDWPGDYANFLRRKQERDHAEQKQNELFDKKLAQEETWIRQGIKARRTRNEGRVRALEALRNERRARREKTGNASLNIQEITRSGKQVVLAENISLKFDDKVIFSNFSTLIIRGDKIGIIGPNGSGKTSLIRTLLQQQQPDSGSVSLGTNLDIAFFDQMRNQLDENKSIRENVGEGKDTLTINGRSKHVVGYLQDFLFTPDRLNTPVKALSGGERNRVMLAKLFTKPANLLVMDEPTNDLDMETLELLEQLLVEFTGTLLLVSHDRAFLNNVVTSTIVFEGDGVLAEYVGGYDDWRRQKESQISVTTNANSGAKPAMKSAKSSEKKAPNEKPKLSYKDQKRLKELPGLIESLEAKIEELNTQMSQAKFYQQDQAHIQEVTSKLQSMQDELEQAYAEWERIEEL